MPAKLTDIWPGTIAFDVSVVKGLSSGSGRFFLEHKSKTHPAVAIRVTGVMSAKKCPREVCSHTCAQPV